MKQRALLLVGGCLALWMLLAYPAYLLGGEAGLLHTAVAALLCLIPTVATLLWCDVAVGKSPEQQLAAVLGGTGLRMAFVVAIGMTLYYGTELFQATSFWLWVIVFYLATLTLEVVLIVRREAASERVANERAALPPGPGGRS